MARVPTLVIDDDPTMRLMLERLLAKIGYAVTTVSTGEEAVAVLDKMPWELVLTDKNLPDITGVEVARKARTRWPASTIVMVTGFATPESARELMGVLDDYFEKPMVLDELARRLSAAMSRRRGMAAAREAQREVASPSTIAVLEPDPDTRAAIVAHLTQAGYTVVGPEALTNADGVVVGERAATAEIERAIWEQQATRASFPAIVLARPQSLRGAQQAVTLWAHTLLTYPLDPAALDKAVRDAFGGLC